LLEVAERQQPSQAQRDGVTALAMGQHGGGVLLLVGHASGAVRVWELKTQLGGERARCWPAVCSDPTYSLSKPMQLGSCWLPHCTGS
jgi:hypothetical protein